MRGRRELRRRAGARAGDGPGDSGARRHGDRRGGGREQRAGGDGDGGARHARARRARHPGEQRGRADLETLSRRDGSGMGLRDRYEPERNLPLHAGRGARHEGSRRFHHQHRIGIEQGAVSGLAAYTASRGGIEMLTKVAAVESVR